MKEKDSIFLDIHVIWTISFVGNCSRRSITAKYSFEYIHINSKVIEFSLVLDAASSVKTPA